MRDLILTMVLLLSDGQLAEQSDLLIYLAEIEGREMREAAE